MELINDWSNKFKPSKKNSSELMFEVIIGIELVALAYAIYSSSQ